jgi:pimeloyl-ACP methyl ester carboxylesterase
MFETLHRGLGLTAVVTIIGSTPRAVPAQQPDTAAVRAAFQAGKQLEAQYERDHGHEVLVNGLRMHYLEWGDRAGVPLVWAHGSMGTGYELKDLAPALVKAGYRLIAPCLRGQGRSQTERYDFTVFHIADDLAAMLDQLGIKAAVVGGSSKGGFVAAAMYDQYPEKVLGLLLHDGGSWSNQVMFDTHGTERLRRGPAGDRGPPVIEGDSQLEVFQKLAGNRITAARPIPAAQVLERLVNINQRPNGRWAFMAGFREMMGSWEGYVASATAPSKLPPLQMSQHLLNPLIVFRNLNVPMMIIDPQDADTSADELPVTDQNLRLQALHPNLVTHKIYPATVHAAYSQRPEWVIRDATELLAKVTGRRGAP